MSAQEWLAQNRNRLLKEKVLTERQLDVFALREFKEMEFRQIGLQFGCTREQARRHYYRARRILARSQL